MLGRDFAFPGAGPWPSAFGVAMRGNGTFVHTDPEDRGSDVYAGRTTLLSGGKHPSFLLLPVVPRPRGRRVPGEGTPEGAARMAPYGPRGAGQDDWAVV